MHIAACSLLRCSIQRSTQRRRSVADLQREAALLTCTCGGGSSTSQPQRIVLLLLSGPLQAAGALLKMSVRPKAFAALMLLVFGSAFAARASKLQPRLLVETSDSGQTSVAWNLPDGYSASPDMPMDEPPLVSRHRRSGCLLS